MMVCRRCYKETSILIGIGRRAWCPACREQPPATEIEVRESLDDLLQAFVPISDRRNADVDTLMEYARTYLKPSVVNSHQNALRAIRS